MRNVAAAAVPQLGDWCAVYFVAEGTESPAVEVAHSDPDKRVWAEELLHRFPYDPDGPRGVPAVIRTGEIEFVPKLSPESIERAIERIADKTLAAELRPIVNGLELTAHVRAKPAPGWLRVRVSTRNFAGGLLEEDAEVWDSRGRLVAQSRQLARAPKS